MKNFFILLPFIIFISCRSNSRPETNNNNHQQQDTIANTNNNMLSILPEENKPIISKRRIFYPAYKINNHGEYYIEKVEFCMLHTPNIFFLDFGMEPTAHRISRMESLSDTLIIFQFDAYCFESYRSKFPNNDFTMHWADSNEGWTQGARMEKNPITLIWILYLTHSDGKETEYRQVIESEDIIPSGHRYVNMETRRHDTNKEAADWLPAPLPPSILTSQINYTCKSIIDEEFITAPESFQPFLGTWILLEEADQGWVIYNRQEEGGKNFIPTTLRIEGDSLIYTSYWETFSMPFDEVRYYEDGTILVWKNDGNPYNSIYTMKWEDLSKGLAYWSLYYSDGRIINNELYVREEMSTYPVYDYDELSMYME